MALFVWLLLATVPQSCCLCVCLWREPFLIALFFVSCFTWLLMRSLVGLSWIATSRYVTMYSFWVLLSSCLEELVRFFVYKIYRHLKSALWESKDASRSEDYPQLEGLTVGTSFATSGFFAGAGMKLVHFNVTGEVSGSALSSETLALVMCIYSLLLSSTRICVGFLSWIALSRYELRQVLLVGLWSVAVQLLFLRETNSIHSFLSLSTLLFLQLLILIVLCKRKYSICI